MQSEDDNDFIQQLNSNAIESADREKLFYYLNDERYARFFPQSKSKEQLQDDRTELLLHSFLESIKDDDTEKKPDRDKNSKKGILDEEAVVSTDYLAYIEHKDNINKKEPKEDKEIKPMKHQQLVDRFLEKSSSDKVLFSTDKKQDNIKRKSVEDVDSLLDGDTFLTETLAQVYIKQKKYEEALTIIKRLSLNFPEKSIYFADQIRFLEYLIFNDKNKK